MNYVIVAAVILVAVGAYGIGWTSSRKVHQPDVVRPDVVLSRPGVNSRCQWLVDLSIDGMGFGYIVLDDGYTLNELAEALNASVFYG